MYNAPEYSQTKVITDHILMSECRLNGLATDILTVAELVSRQVMYITDLTGSNGCSFISEVRK